MKKNEMSVSIKSLLESFNGKLYEDYGEFDYSCVELLPPKETAEDVLKLVTSIPVKHLYVENDSYGMCLNPHITLKYGLTTATPEEVKEKLKGIAKIPVVLGKIGKFAEEGKPYEVVKVDVEPNEQLSKVHDLLSELDNEDSHSEYKPHMTLAYVKPGVADKYVGDDRFKGVKFSVFSVAFKGKDKSDTEIKFKDSTTVEESAGLFEGILEDMNREFIRLSTLDTERLSLLLFKDRRLINVKNIDIASGTYTQVRSDPKEIASMVVQSDADEVVDAHNHPDSILLPSPRDIEAARRVEYALELSKWKGKLRFFIVAGENQGKSGTSVVPPSWVEYNTDGDVIDKFVQRGPTSTVWGVSITIPAGATIHGQGKGKVLGSLDKTLQTQAIEDGEYYSFDLGRGRTGWVHKNDVTIAKAE